MKMTHLNKLLGAALITTFSAVALAAGMGSSQFETLDQNKDGQLNAGEASKDKVLSENWSKVDKDNSGTVDQAEFSAFEASIEQPSEHKTKQ